jgi:lipid-A-disaccharide synthase
MVAGEASGDLHASGVAEELRRSAPELPLLGIGGSRMERAGVSLLEHTDRLAVMGFSEVVKHIPKHYRLLAELRSRLRSGRVGLVMLVDYPGFNMKVAAAAHEAGVPVLYYITPQVWAWGEGRLAKMERIVTKAAVILPFEEELLSAHGIDATFVGHPLLDRAAEHMPARAAARAQLGLPEAAPVLALFPGSRAQEIARHLDSFVATARELERRIAGLQVIVSVAPGITVDAARCPYRLVHAASFTVWRAADAALSKSGTSTLEAAVAGCPLVVAYRTGALNYAIARRVVRIPHIGLVNVVAGREVAPEFIQHELRPERVADALEPLLARGSAERETMLDGLAEVRSRLGDPGAAARVAKLVLSTMKHSEPASR